MTPEEKTAHLEQQALQTPIAEMGLPIRIVNALEEDDMILCAHIMIRDRESLLRVSNFGESTLKEVVAAVKRLGLRPHASWAQKKPAARKPARPKPGPRSKR